MNTIILKGIVFTGANVALKSLSPLFEQIKYRSGISSLIPGTLNLKLAQDHIGYLDIIFLAHEYNHHEHVFLERCNIFNKKALIARTSTNFHGNTVIEVIAQEHLRETYDLKDGDEVEVEVYKRLRL